ncbi:UNVERIFIED_ORG: hypothetical protein ABID33_000140 [Xanthobacter viscosus]|jgi:hypothetical protein|uniref:DUF1194 domain-containing protein n=1 Tax=Xanthobacter autotrophicus TaxID=280 RepID=A0A6C1KTR7_XANAU|nr:DUF1194 domain-containing protein [Xanthobacter autotrophicus]TLX43956.1 DUF1194 domain-containing protein [Xanthobacter autotrophicus]
MFSRRFWSRSLVSHRLVLGLAFLVLAGTAPARAGSSGMDVDLELVLAVDVSYSMDTEEQALQREGYASAVVSREFLDALRLGPSGRIAVEYVEWAGDGEQKVVVDWRIIDSPQTAKAFADAVMGAPLRRVYRTSISSALLFSADQFDLNGYKGVRRVIDVSGDGVNNQGPPVALARDAVVQRGITVNGLPLLLKRAASSALDVPELDAYYEDCVIGGPGAFVIPVQQMEEFARAIKTKLVMEVAGMVPPPAPGLIQRAAATEPRVSCTIGEKIWMDHWAN